MAPLQLLVIHRPAVPQLNFKVIIDYFWPSKHHLPLSSATPRRQTDSNLPHFAAAEKCHR